MGILDSVLPAAAMYAGYAMGGPVGGALAAGAMGYMGTMQTNAANKDIASANNAFNAEQAGLNRNFSDEQAQRQMDFQANQIQQQQDYQTTMSNTSYQRAVRDLEAAGLNPMLAYAKGGASTPTGGAAAGAMGMGSSAQAQSVSLQNPISAGVQAYQSASSALQASAFVDQINATTDKIREETKNVPDQGQVLKFTVQKLAEEAALAAQRGETEVSIRKLQAATIANLKRDGILKDLDIDAAKTLDNIGRESQQLKPIADMLRLLLK